MSAAASEFTTTPRRRAIVWAGIAIVLTAVNLRTAVTGFTPLLETIGQALGFPVTVAGVLGTIPAVSFAVFGFLAPVVTRRFGLERTATVALGLTALSLLLRAFAPDTALLIASTVLALAGIGAANVVIVPLVKAWFPERIARWTSVYLILMQSGQFLAPLIAVPVAEASSWRFSVGVWAVPAAISAVVWFVVARRARARDAGAASAAAAASATPATPTAPPARLRIARSSVVWGLVVLFAMLSVSNYAIITWVPAILTEAGGSPAFGGAMVALYSSWGIVAAFVVPQLATRMPNPFAVVVVCAVLLVVGYLGLLLAPLAATAVWMCALGLGVSTFPLCMTLINRRTLAPSTAASVSGFVQGIGYAIACLAPVGLGLLRDASGSWGAPLAVLIASTVPGLVAGWFACRPRFVDDEGALPAR